MADDFVYVARFRELPWADWPGLFLREWSGGVWGQPLRELRPFAALSLMADARTFGADPLGYRVTNLLLHLLATLLVLRLAWRYTGGRATAAALAGLLFAIHPAHVEAVAWITGRVDLLATAAALLFWLAAEQFSDRGRPAVGGVAVAALFVGVFSKELCLFAPPLLLAAWLLADPRAGRTVWLRRLAILGGAVVVIGTYAVCRRIALPSEGIGYNVWTDVPAWNRQLSYAAWLFPWLPYTTESELSVFPPIGWMHGVWIALAVATFAGLVLAVARRSAGAARLLFFGGFWYFATVSTLTAVVYHSPRHLYFPTVGLALALGLLAARGRVWTIAAALFVVACLGGHAAAARWWIQAGNASRAAVAAIDAGVAKQGPGTVAVVSAAARVGPAWLWPWCSPACMGAPFVTHPPQRVIEHPVNYARSDDWAASRRPFETVAAATALVAVHVDGAGVVRSRELSGPALVERQRAFAALAASGLGPDAWDAWVRSTAQP